MKNVPTKLHLNPFETNLSSRGITLSVRPGRLCGKWVAGLMKRKVITQKAGILPDNKKMTRGFDIRAF